MGAPDPASNENLTMRQRKEKVKWSMAHTSLYIHCMLNLWQKYDKCSILRGSFAAAGGIHIKLTWP